MKKITALLLLVFSGFGAAWSQAIVTSVSYNKASQPGLLLELPYNEQVSEGFIVDNLKKTGYDPETKGKMFWKQNKINGFYIFKDVRLEGLDKPVDLYFRVDQKSRKEKDESIIYLLVSKPGEENFYSSGTDESVYNAAKRFLNGFVEQSAVYKLDLDIKSHEESVKNEEKKLQKLQDNEKDMNKKIEQLQKDLKKNRSEQEDVQKNLESEKKKLSDLKSQKSN